MRGILGRSLLVCASLVLSSGPAAADTYFVGPGGRDCDAGTARRPWSTLQHAADRVGPGDTVIVLPGTYAGFNLVTSGSEGRPIRFSARRGAVIDRAASGEHRSRINLDGVSHVVIEGFEIVGTSDQSESKEGIRVIGPGDGSAGHITIRRNHVHHNGDRNILTGFVSNLTIEHNVAHHAHQEHGIYVSNSADDHVIRGNVVYGNAASGIQVNADASLGGDGVITGVLIEDNLVHDNGAGGGWVNLGKGPVRARGGGSAINLDGVQRSIVRGNLLLDNHASGISLYRIDGGQPSHGNLVTHNIIVNARDGRWALNIQDGSSGNTVRNNLLFSRHPLNGAIRIDARSLVNLASDDNIVEDGFAIDDRVIDLASWRRRTGDDHRSITPGLPGFLSRFRDRSGPRARRVWPATSTRAGVRCRDRRRESLAAARAPLTAEVSCRAVARLGTCC
ncbi:MAG TPA: right-handed parallel beta-helix repeat-containing protein [Kofleriaceae bacterium]|nr:right-handed parallel beta-helix repeat-containing protein [Kofleriaceae bacterium]